MKPLAFNPVYLVSFFLFVSFTWSAEKGPSTTEPEKTTEVLTMTDCLREGLASNADLRVAEKNLRRYDFLLRGAVSPLFPKISAKLGDSYSGTSGNNASLGLSASADLFTGFKNTAALRKAKTDFDVARAGFTAAKLAAENDILAAFYNLLYAQENVGVSRSIEARRRENNRLVQLRFDTGREDKGALLRSEAQVREAEVALSNAALDLGLEKKNLALILGREKSGDLVVNGDFGTNEVSDTADFRALALKTPAYLETRANLEAARASRDSTRSSLFPSLGASGSYSRSGSVFLNGSGDFSASVNLSYAFNLGLGDFWNTAAQDTQVAADEIKWKHAVSSIAYDLEKALVSYRQAEGKMQVQKKFLEALETQAEIAKSKYATGLFTYEDWDLIETDLINSQKTALASVRDTSLARANWEKIKGTM